VSETTDLRQVTRNLDPGHDLRRRSLPVAEIDQKRLVVQEKNSGSGLSTERLRIALAKARTDLGCPTFD